MLACRRVGVTVPQKPNDEGLRFLLSRQQKNGGFAEWHYVQAVSLNPNASRIKTVNAILKRLLNTQQADGTWKPDSSDPLRQPVNAAILLHQASIRR